MIMSSNGITDRDPYAPDDYQSFVKVGEDTNSDDFMELPTECDETILLTTLQGQFPNAVGLKYKSSSGSWRAVRISNDTLNPPSGGWGDVTYIVTFRKEPTKRKGSELESKDEPATKLKKESSARSESRFLQDLVVFSLPFKCTDEDLKEYFSKNCGELAYYEVKYDRKNNKPRGFGFIRFKTAEACKKALHNDHIIMGRKCEIRLSKKKEEPMKIFVGRIPSNTSQEDLKEYFSEFGEVSDAYIPPPFRGFGFVTYAYSEDGRAALQSDHKIKGIRLNVQYAEPKEEKEARKKMEKLARLSDERVDYRGEEYGFDPLSSRDMQDSMVMDYPRDMRDPIDIEYGRDARQSRETRDSREMRDSRDRDSRNIRDSRDVRDSNDTRYSRDVRESRDMRDSRDIRDSRDVRESRDMRDSREMRDSRDMRDMRDLRDPRDLRDSRDVRSSRDIKPPRDARSSRDTKVTKSSRDTRGRYSQHDPTNDSRYDARDIQQTSLDPRDMTSELKNMLFSILSRNPNL